MSYRDPLEAMRAENESLKTELRSTREALEHALGQGVDMPEGGRGRWSLGVRCLGGLAMMTPFLLMTALCEHRMSPRRAYHAPPMPSAASLVAATPAPQGCVMARPHRGFERFTTAVERPATVVESSNLPSARVGQRCTLRVAPVSLPDFNCHIDVICDGAVLYGVHPMGYAHCDVDGAAPIAGRDPYFTSEDSDPAVNFDLRAGRVVVDDQREGQRTHAVLRLDVPATR